MYIIMFINSHYHSAAILANNHMNHQHHQQIWGGVKNLSRQLHAEGEQEQMLPAKCGIVSSKVISFCKLYLFVLCKVF